MLALFIVSLQCSAHLAGPQSIFVGRTTRWKEGGNQTQGDNFLTTAAFLQHGDVNLHSKLKQPGFHFPLEKCGRQRQTKDQSEETETRQCKVMAMTTCAGIFINAITRQHMPSVYSLSGTLPGTQEYFRRKQRKNSDLKELHSDLHSTPGSAT